MQKRTRSPRKQTPSPIDQIAASFDRLAQRLTTLEMSKDCLWNALTQGAQPTLPGTPRLDLAEMARDLNALRYRVSRLELYVKRAL